MRWSLLLHRFAKRHATLRKVWTFRYRRVNTNRTQVRGWYSSKRAARVCPQPSSERNPDSCYCHKQGACQKWHWWTYNLIYTRQWKCNLASHLWAQKTREKNNSRQVALTAQGKLSTLQSHISPKKIPVSSKWVAEGQNHMQGSTEKHGWLIHIAEDQQKEDTGVRSFLVHKTFLGAKHMQNRGRWVGVDNAPHQTCSNCHQNLVRSQNPKLVTAKFEAMKKKPWHKSFTRDRWSQKGCTSEGLMLLRRVT